MKMRPLYIVAEREDGARFQLNLKQYEHGDIQEEKGMHGAKRFQLRLWHNCQKYEDFQPEGKAGERDVTPESEEKTSSSV